MFYFIVSRLPIISSVEEGKFLRIFIIGTICYIILHAFLYSNYNSGSEIVQKYRSYLYYLWGADLLITGLIVKLFGGNNNEIDDDTYEQEEIYSQKQQYKFPVTNYKQPINNGYAQNNYIQREMTNEELKKKLEEIKKYEIEVNNEQESLQQSSPSPFIKKDESKKSNDKLPLVEKRINPNVENTLPKINQQIQQINNNEQIVNNKNKTDSVTQYSETELQLYQEDKEDK